MAEQRDIYNVHHQAILVQGSSLSFLGGTPKGDKPSGVLVYALLRGVPSPCLRTVVPGGRRRTRFLTFSVVFFFLLHVHASCDPQCIERAQSVPIARRQH